MSDIASIEVLSARQTLIDGLLARRGHLRLIVIIWMCVIRVRGIKAQRKKTVRATAGTQLRQGFSHGAARSCFRLSASAPSGARRVARCPDEGQQVSLRPYGCDGPRRSTAPRNYPHLMVFLRCALWITPSNWAVIAR
jgi:hypothetical protein